MEAGWERTWRLTKRAYTVHAEVPASLYDAMLRIQEAEAHRNLSEYMRDLIEKDVEERGIELAPIEDFGGEGMEDVLKSPVTFEAGVVSTRVPMLMMEMINGLLASGFYLRVSDYLRYVVRKDLESRGIEPRLVKAGAEEEKEPAKVWRPSATTTVSTQVPMAMMEDIDRLLASGLYFRVTDYLIDIIRKDLESRDLFSSKSFPVV